MISSWAKTLKWVKHKVDIAYQSKKIHMKLWDKFFKDDFKLSKDLKMGEARAIILVTLVIWKSDTIYQSHECMWKLFQIGQNFKMGQAWGVI